MGIEMLVWWGALAVAVLEWWGEHLPMLAEKLCGCVPGLTYLGGVFARGRLVWWLGIAELFLRPSQGCIAVPNRGREYSSLAWLAQEQVLPGQICYTVLQLEVRAMGIGFPAVQDQSHSQSWAHALCS